MRPSIDNNLGIILFSISWFLNSSVTEMLGKKFSAIERGKKDKLDKNSAELATFNQKSLFVVDWKNDGDRVQHLDFSLISMTK